MVRAKPGTSERTRGNTDADIGEWIGPGSSSHVGRLYDAVDSMVDAAVRRPLSETRAAALALARDVERGTAPSNAAAIKLAERAAMLQDGLTYAETKQLRTEIGARLSGSILPEAGTSMPALKRLYGALTDDLRSIILRAGGKDAEAAFNAANTLAGTVSDWRQKLAGIVQGDAPAERIVDKLLAMASSRRGADVNRLFMAQQAMGDAWNEVAGAAVRQLGHGPDGFSIARLRNSYANDLSETGRQLLFGGKGTPLRDRLDALVTNGGQAERLQAALQKGTPSAIETVFVGDATATEIGATRGLIAKVLGADGAASPEAIVDRLAAMASAKGGADVTRLGQVKAIVSPGAWDDLASAVLRQMGQTKDGISIARLRTAYGNLSKNGRDLVFGTGEWRQTLDKVMNVTKQFEFLQKAGNPSGTAKAVATVTAIPFVLSNPLSVIGGVVGNRMLASWLSKPVPAAKVARWMQAYTAAATKPNPAQLTVLDQASWWRNGDPCQVAARRPSRALAQVAAAQGLERAKVESSLDQAAQTLPRNRGTRADTGPWRTTVQPATGRADLAGNQTVQTLLQRGVHPSNAEMAVGNAQLALAMLHRPDAYREPGTGATRLIEQRRQMGTAVGGVG